MDRDGVDAGPVTVAGCLLLALAPDAHYRSAPFRDPHLGRDGVLAYTRDAYATETDQDPRLGAPFATGSGPSARGRVVDDPAGGGPAGHPERSTFRTSNAAVAVCGSTLSTARMPST
jgi:hypothetical protein